ncbi:MAG: hypothetical protein V9E94_14705 [Microthrixaceae bacterium]
MRAASENTDRARLLGVPVRNLTTAVWAIAGALAALTFVLQAPFRGAAPSAAAGPAVLLPALAAAIVARMESLPKAFAAAVGLGRHAGARALEHEHPVARRRRDPRRHPRRPAPR